MARQWVHMARSAKPIWTTKKSRAGREIFRASSFSDSQKHLFFSCYEIYIAMTRSTKIIKYVSRRLFQGVPIILAIIVINFFLLNLAEGDAVDVLAGEAGSATPE